MIKRFLLVVFVSATLLFGQTLYAQAPQQEEKPQYKFGATKIKIVKPKPTVNYIRLYPIVTVKRFPWGYCRWLVAQKFPVTWSGNANMWIANARTKGYEIRNKPKVGSIVQTREGRIGHVAYVVKVEKTRFQIIEMNYKGFGITSYRWIPNNYWAIEGFITR